MSILLPYFFIFTTSGAILKNKNSVKHDKDQVSFLYSLKIIYQYGVPTTVHLFSSGDIWAQKPKSVTLTDPSIPSKTLSDFF